MPDGNNDEKLLNLIIAEGLALTWSEFPHLLYQYYTQILVIGIGIRS